MKLTGKLSTLGLSTMTCLVSVCEKSNVQVQRGLAVTHSPF